MSRSDTVKMRVLFGARSILAQFTVQSLIKSSILFGLLVGGIVALQGFGYTSAYTTPDEREVFAQTLTSNPSLGILYGQPVNLTEPVGYIAYRCLPILMIIASIWGLAIITKRLRGQEEDGRWELLLTGETTATRAVIDTLVGVLVGIGLMSLIATAIIVTVGQSPQIGAGVWDMAFFGLCIVSVAFLFVGIGSLTSQLAASRRRAMLYGLGILAVFYVLRAVANVVSGLAWLRDFTPLGWVERAHPLTMPHPLWLVPVVILGALCMVAGAFIASKRDLGESLIRERSAARSRFGLLSSASFFSIRSSWPQLSGWAFAVLVLVSIIASVSKLAVGTVTNSNINGVLNEFSGNASAGAVMGFLSMASFFGVLLLMIMATTALGSVRAEEAKSYLDNLLVRQTGRAGWLLGRIGIILGGSVIVSLLANTVVWMIAGNSGVDVSAHDLIFEGLNLLGPVAFIVGFGVLLYGVKPRLVIAGAYALIGWSFLIDMLRVVVDLPQWVVKSSLFSHIALVPAVHPGWSDFLWLVALGGVMAFVGVYSFTKRDLEVE